MIQKIYKTENVIRVSPDESLSTIIPHFTSSHDAGFVFEDMPKKGQQGKFLGVVNPYYALIKKSYPANTKAKHCLMHPPKVDISFSIEKTAQLMMSSKIHYLPVFEQEKFIGIISARRIIENIMNSDKLDVVIDQYIDKRKAVLTISEDEYISKAMAMFKKFHISKLIVVGPDKKLRGVLSYYDLISFLTVPKERAGFSRTGGKTPLLQTKVRNFMKINVLTLGLQNTIAEAAEMVIKQQIGSVLIIDSERKPISIITTRDILTCYAGKKQLIPIDLVTKDLSEKSRVIVNEFVKQIQQRFLQKHIVDRVRVIVKQAKGKKHMFEAVVALFKQGEKLKVIKKEGKNLQEVLTEVGKRSKPR